ncbi:MAG: TIGR04282 family arsenosugar biosynthesis glycosyltransferase [Gammaproteobacteria bacterium]
MIFCKAPVPGQVKTRLNPELSSIEAALLHRELSERTFKMAARRPLCPVQLWCAPSPDHPFFAEKAGKYGFQLRKQQGADLGERMNHAFSAALTHCPHAILIGCDSPSLTDDDLETALTALNTDADIVLAPAEDGGYVLIGLNRPHPGLFENMPWGTADVLSETRARIDHHRFRYRELKEQWDVDAPGDLLRYRQTF